MNAIFSIPMPVMTRGQSRPRSPRPSRRRRLPEVLGSEGVRAARGRAGGGLARSGVGWSSATDCTPQLEALQPAVYSAGRCPSSCPSVRVRTPRAQALAWGGVRIVLVVARPLPSATVGFEGSRQLADADGSSTGCRAVHPRLAVRRRSTIRSGATRSSRMNPTRPPAPSRATPRWRGRWVRGRQDRGLVYPRSAGDRPNRPDRHRGPVEQQQKRHLHRAADSRPVQPRLFDFRQPWPVRAGRRPGRPGRRPAPDRGLAEVEQGSRRIAVLGVSMEELAPCEAASDDRIAAIILQSTHAGLADISDGAGLCRLTPRGPQQLGVLLGTSAPDGRNVEISRSGAPQSSRLSRRRSTSSSEWADRSIRNNDGEDLRCRRGRADVPVRCVI